MTRESSATQRTAQLEPTGPHPEPDSSERRRTLQLTKHNQQLAAENAERLRMEAALRKEIAERERVEAALRSEIAERERIEAALRASESRFRTLSDSGAIGILRVDTAGHIFDANEAFARMIGYSRAEILSGSVLWTALTPDGWQERDARAIREIETTGMFTALEKEYIHKDGRRVPVLLGGARLEGSHDCICYALDQTERKRAEEISEKLRQQHEIDLRFRALLETAPDAMVVVGSAGTITLVNEQAEKLFGYTRDELIGESMSLLVPPRFRERHASWFALFCEDPSARAMATGIELFGLRKDGSELPIEVSLSPLECPGGVTVSAAVRNISERKRLEVAARLVSDRLASALEAMHEAIGLFDASGRLVLCNQVFERLASEKVPEPLLGTHYADMLATWLPAFEFESEGARERFYNERLRRPSGAATTTFDIPLCDGRTLRIIDRITPEGGIVKTVWDITEDVRIAAELREARSAAESASKAKSDFLSSMSHELRTPLNAVLGFAQLLQHDKKHPLSERHRERVGEIMKAGEHLLRLIEDILDVSRIESGSIAISLEPTNAFEVLEHVMPTLEPLAARASIELRIEAASRDLPLIAADRTRYAQVIMNFASNAIKYNRSGGTVTFRLSRPDPQHVRMSVSDTGLGVPPHKQDKLFQAFQRAGQETGPIEGTGIGLFITKRLAELMRGQVGFHSVHEQGSDFWIDMPLAESEPPQQAASLRAQSARPALSGPKRVLHVEDNPANITFIRDLIASMFEHVELLSAATGERGIELARAHRLDAVIMDINLPGMSGFDALSELRRERETRDLPVIAVSAAASEHDRRRGLQSGFHAYLTKPVDVEEFVSTLETVLS